MDLQHKGIVRQCTLCKVWAFEYSERIFGHRLLCVGCFVSLRRKNDSDLNAREGQELKILNLDDGNIQVFIPGGGPQPSNGKLFDRAHIFPSGSHIPGEDPQFVPNGTPTNLQEGFPQIQERSDQKTQNVINRSTYGRQPFGSHQLKSDNDDLSEQPSGKDRIRKNLVA